MAPRLLFITLTLFIVAVFGARLYARKSASDFGGALAASAPMTNRDAFGDTRGLEDFLTGPEMAGYQGTVGRLSILGGGYDVRMEEVRRGLVYLSRQLSLPQERRFLQPPSLRHLKIEPDGTSDRAVFDAARKLIHEFRRQIV